MQDIADAPDDANPMEQADVAVAQAVAPLRHTLPVRALGALSELSDQPPLIALSAGTFAFGLLRGDRRLAETGGRMLSAHLLATAIKSAIKARIVRTRPKTVADGADYRMHEGDENAHPVNSFPSGHTPRRGGGGAGGGARPPRSPPGGLCAIRRGGLDADPALHPLSERRGRGRGDRRGGGGDGVWGGAAGDGGVKSSSARGGGAAEPLR